MMMPLSESKECEASTTTLETGLSPAEGQNSQESRACFGQHFREQFGEEGRVQVRVLGRFGSFRHAHVKIDGDHISLHGENITSFVEFPKHSNHLLSSSWSDDLRYFIVFVDGCMTMVELVPEAPPEPRVEKEFNLIYHSGVIAALQTAKRHGDFEGDPTMLIELIHRTRQFAKPFLRAPLTLERFLELQKVMGVAYFGSPSISGKDAETVVEDYLDMLFAPSRTAKLWNHAGLIEAIAFMDFECALKCFEAGINVAEDDATEAMLCANWGQVSGEAMVANFDLSNSCPKRTLKHLNRASRLDPRFIDTDFGVPLLSKPWLLYMHDTLDGLCEWE